MQIEFHGCFNHVPMVSFSMTFLPTSEYILSLQQMKFCYYNIFISNLCLCMQIIITKSKYGPLKLNTYTCLNTYFKLYALAYSCRILLHNLCSFKSTKITHVQCFDFLETCPSIWGLPTKLALRHTRPSWVWIMIYRINVCVACRYIFIFTMKNSKHFEWLLCGFIWLHAYQHNIKISNKRNLFSSLESQMLLLKEE